MPTAFQHVVYLSGDLEVIEPYYPFGGGDWAFNPIRAAAGATPPRAGTTLTSWRDGSLSTVS